MNIKNEIVTTLATKNMREKIIRLLMHVIAHIHMKTMYPIDEELNYYVHNGQGVNNTFLQRLWHRLIFQIIMVTK